MIKLKKLALNAETIRVLTGPELRRAAGAASGLKNTRWGPAGGDCSFTDHNSPRPCPSIDPSLDPCPTAQTCETYRCP